MTVLMPLLAAVCLLSIFILLAFGVVVLEFLFPHADLLGHGVPLNPPCLKCNSVSTGGGHGLCEMHLDRWLDERYEYSWEQPAVTNSDKAPRRRSERPGAGPPARQRNADGHDQNS